LLRAHSYYRTAEFLLPSEDPKRPVAGLGSLRAATSGCVLRISTKLRDVVRRLLGGRDGEFLPPIPKAAITSIPPRIREPKREFWFPLFIL
jgi:hypothetical protein